MPNTTSQETLIRFSLRAILALVSVASVMLAITIPFVNLQPRGMRGQLHFAIGIAAALALVAFVILCVRRWRIEQISGKLLLLPPLTHWGRWIPSALLILIFSAVLLGTGYVMVIFMKSTSGLEEELNVPLFILVFSVSGLVAPMFGLTYAFVLLWWRVSPMSMEIRERGIVVGGLRFLKWSDVNFEWQEGKHAAILNIVSASRKHVALVAHSARSVVDDQLRAMGARVR